MNRVNNILEVRAFIIHELMEKFGAAATADKVVGMAKEIEKYMTDGIDVPEVSEPSKLVDKIIEGVTSLSAINVADLKFPEPENN